MAILLDGSSRVLTQGITGKVGSYHTLRCLNYGMGRDCFVGGVNPKRGGEIYEDMKIFATVAEAKEETNANVSVIYVPPLQAADAIIEAARAKIKLIVCITEGIPINDMLRVRSFICEHEPDVLLLGPNCPGLITPGVLKVGIMPESIHTPGRIGIVSRSGTLTYEAVAQVTEVGMGQSTAVGIGGDPINGLKHIDVLKMFNEDQHTDAVIMIGEIGGNDEVVAAEWAKENMRKPIIGFIAGMSAPEGKRMGHAGALINKNSEKADAKLEAMESAGIIVTKNPARLGITLKQSL
ncbi:MAG: succinate--CoA ligase subunit alpha [Burkholderiaceae bacterium]